MKIQNKYKAFLLGMLLCGACSPGTSSAQTAVNGFSNPVTLGLRDGCVERFMGRYYAMGGGTKGKMRSSANMVDWTSDVLAVTTDKATWLNDPQWKEAYVYKEVAAGDIIYYNGVFHTYWNGIGHGYSAVPLGPYTEASTAKPFDDYGIDPQVFQDENGDLYYVKKRNQADPDPVTGAESDKQGPETWIFKMKTPFDRWDVEASGMQLRHQPGHPTSLNHHNFEGPELFKYRGRYYIFYACNRMGPRSGMYEIGVAESDGPMNFNNGKKYPHPVLARNTEQHLLDYHIILHTAEHGGWTSRYTIATPASGWTEASFDDSRWTSAQGGYGKQEDDLFGNTAKRTNVKVRARKTAWSSPNIYIRRKFTLDETPRKTALKHWVYGDADFYINGHKLSISTRHNTYAVTQIDPSWLKTGENIIAVQATSPCSDAICQQFIDFGLYDTGDREAEDIVIAPAQPNVIAGPNGFEQWMMYKAYFNASEQQAVDRVHFYDKEAVVESSTVKNTAGYRPRPALPTFTHNCDHSIYYPLDYLGESKWRIYGGILYPTTPAGGELLLRKEAESNYRFEASLRIKDDETKAGVYAFWQDEDNWLKILIGKDKTWTIQTCTDGTVANDVRNLPEKFAFLDSHPQVESYDEPWHTLTVYKNDSRFRVELDRFNLTLDGDLSTPFNGKGVVGLSTSSNQTDFDALQYTMGWDEYDNRIAGWEHTDGTWSVSDDGLAQTSADGQASAFKGDPAWNYEFSAYMSHEQLPASGRSGYYPLYIDEQNYVRASVDYTQKTLEIEGMADGSPLAPQSLPLKKRILRQYTVEEYPTTTYRYDLRNESLLSGVNILWLEGNYSYLNQTFDLPAEVRFEALQGESWVPLNAQLEGTLRFSEMNHFTFPAVKTTAIRMLVANQAGKASRAFCAYFDEEASAGYFLRCRREEDGLHIFLDDVYMARLEDRWGQARIGLYTDQSTARYNGMMYYQSGKIAVKSISIAPVECAIGESAKLSATVLPLHATHHGLYWESSHPEIASVTPDGTVTRHTAGYAKITAYTTDGGIVKGSVEFEGKNKLAENTADKFIIYPNPADKELFYSLPDAEQITVYSITGEKLLQHKPDGSNRIQIDRLNPGPYILLATRHDDVHTARFIVSH